MKYLYRIYQLCVALPLLLLWTVCISLMVVVGCTVGNGHFWGYYPGRWWGRAIIRLLLLPVTVEGQDNMKADESYVIAANHQGAFDIFLVFGFLNRQFKWMMKYQLRKIPFVGWACEKSHQIFVDKRGPRRVKETYDKARATLRGGMSVVVFPEGARTFTGHMGVFRRGAFLLADELQLPVLPLTINGSFDIMPRTRDCRWAVWHPLRLTIHKPIYPQSQGPEDITRRMQQCYDAIMSGLVPEYQGYVENPDQ